MYGGDGCLIFGTPDSVSGQLAALGSCKLSWSLTFGWKRTGTFFADTAAGNLYVYIFYLGQKGPTTILTWGYLRFFACVGHTNLGMRYDNLSSELQINGR